MTLEQSLIELNLIDARFIDQAKTLHPTAALQQTLLDMGALSEEQLIQAYTHITNIPCWNSEGEVNKETTYTAEFLIYNNVLPIKHQEHNYLIIDNALDDGLIDLLKRQSPDTLLALYPSSEINQRLTDNFETEDQFSDDQPQNTLNDTEHLKDLALEAPIIRIVNDFFNQAVRLSASDIHLEPSRTQIELRYRVDGILITRTAPDISDYPAIVSRIKILAQLDISERRLPQDGRIRTQSSGHTIDIRVSTVPTPHGEDIVMRILDQKKQILDLDQSGITPSITQKFKNNLSQSHGIILVTGPTGSGKTTTLYSSLQYIVDGKKKIITVEDPVEYEIPNITQIPVQENIDMGFNNALRAILRHDPDIIFIGEIRDKETAEIAIQASLTGHLVLTTLHTNSAIGAITRFLDMGIPDYLLASSLLAVSAQRLIRTLCPACKTSHEPETALLQHYQLKADNIYYQAHGCHKCNQTGYQGRTPIAEFISITSTIRQTIISNPNIDSLNKAAHSEQSETLLTDALSKVITGQTSIEEVQRVCG